MIVVTEGEWREEEQSGLVALTHACVQQQVIIN
jgi:hypothetical protein